MYFQMVIFAFYLPLVSLKRTVTHVWQHWISWVTMVCIQSIFVDWMNSLLNTSIKDRTLTDDVKLQWKRIRWNSVRKPAWQALVCRMWVMAIGSSQLVISWIPQGHLSNVCVVLPGRRWPAHCDLLGYCLVVWSQTYRIFGLILHEKAVFLFPFKFQLLWN